MKPARTKHTERCGCRGAVYDIVVYRKSRKQIIKTVGTRIGMPVEIKLHSGFVLQGKGARKSFMAI